MQIDYYENDRIVFAPAPLKHRLGALIAIPIALFFSLLFLVLLGESRVHVLYPSIADAMIVLAFLLSLACIGVACFAAFKVLPFRLELSRNPLRTRLTWGNWHVATRTWPQPQAVVAKVEQVDRYFRFGVLLRSRQGTRRLLTSHGFWHSPTRAEQHARALGSELAIFLGCSFGIEEPNAFVAWFRTRGYYRDEDE